MSLSLSSSSPTVGQREVSAAAEQLARDTTDLWAPSGEVERLAAPPDAIEFLREHVSRSVPVVIHGVMDGWPAAQWTDDHLWNRHGDAEVSVNVTPDGRGDAVKPVEGRGRCFVLPEERRMPLRAFWDRLTHRQHDDVDGVPYLSRQDDSLRTELPQLAKDVPACVPFARQAFGNEPEAVNLWIGDDRSLSTTHRDFYENVYCVLRGEKLFTLLPPSDAPWVSERPFRVGRHRFDADAQRWVVDVDEAAPPVNWVDADVSGDLSPHAHPLRVSVKAGETLYLPAQWYHQVEQRGVTVAVNYWHDMAFDCKYVMQQFLRALFVPPPSLEATQAREQREEEEADRLAPPQPSAVAREREGSEARAAADFPSSSSSPLAS